MKILYLITRSERGGAQTHLLTLMRLQRFGIPVLAVGDEGFLADEARRAGISVHIVPRLVHAIRPSKDWQALRQLTKLIRSERPALVHAHTSKAGMLARIAGLLTRTPTIYTVHGWSFDALRSPLLKALSLWIERALTLTDHTIVDVSRFNFEMAERLAVARPSRHTVIWNGIPDNPCRADFTGLEGPLKIIMVARLAPQKDHCLLLDALASLPGEWQCSFVGSGPGHASVEAKVRGLGLQNRVQFLGDRDDVPELLANSHLFVLATHYEGLPISILEAMRAGLPVVASAVGGCPELIEDGVTGLLAKPGDVGHMRACLINLINNRALLPSLGQASRHKFEAQFRVESMVRQTEAAYQHLCFGKDMITPPQKSLTPSVQDI